MRYSGRVRSRRLCRTSLAAQQAVKVWEKGCKTGGAPYLPLGLRKERVANWGEYSVFDSLWYYRGRQDGAVRDARPVGAGKGRDEASQLYCCRQEQTRRLCWVGEVERKRLNEGKRRSRKWLGLEEKGKGREGQARALLLPEVGRFQRAIKQCPGWRRVSRLGGQAQTGKRWRQHRVPAANASAKARSLASSA